jgi:hypothetical protein
MSLAGPATAYSQDKNARTHLEPPTNPHAGNSLATTPDTVLATRAPVPKESPFMKDVQSAREKAIGFLKQKQNKAGTWESGDGDGLPQIAVFEGGLTALVVVALLEAGVPLDDPAITKSVEYLAQLPPTKTYVVSLQTQALARAAPKKHADQIQRNIDWLLDHATRFEQDGSFLGWNYGGGAGADASNTHFAVFALHVAARAGAKVDEKIWKEIRNHYVRTQRDYGWAYASVPGGADDLFDDDRWTDRVGNRGPAR